MNFDEMMKNFDNYVNTFDMVDAIKGKFEHSYRVMKYSMDIASSITCDNDEKKLICLGALYHDLGRFEQWIKYNTYVDAKSVDHGDLGADIFKSNFFINNEQAKVIELAIKYHNKKKIPNVLNQEEEKVLKIARDADKLDIMVNQGNNISKMGSLNTELLKDIYQKKLCRNTMVNTDIDIILRQLSFIFDINYEWSIKYIVDKKIIDKKIDLLLKYGDKPNETLKLKDFLYNYIKKEFNT